MAAALRLAPIAWMEAEISRNDNTKDMFERRQAALLNDFAKDERDDVLDQVRPEHEANNLARLRVSWPQEPDLLMIDGVRLTPAEVSGIPLVVTSDRSRVFAVRGARFAYWNGFPSGNGTSVTLMYQPLIESSAADAEATCKGRRWFDCLLRTSGPGLQPRAAALAWPHWQALHQLGLDNLIDVTDWNAIPSEHWATVRRWQSAGLPLHAWN